jgi:oxygen-dependent protoporphyrinogen oxidase
MLGTLFTSNIFPGRSPDGAFLMTTMLGGAHEPDLVDRPDDELVAVVREELRAALTVEVAPRLVRAFRHPRGIPQYTAGHLDRVASIEARLADHAGLHVCGNSYRGISVNLCVAEAPGVADAVVRGLTGRSGSDGV